VRAIWNGAVVAESDETIVVEGNHYFPRDAIKPEYFVESDTTSTCAWKGEAAYFDVAVDGKINKDAAWHYDAPKAEAEHIAGRVAFWRGVSVES
jgi:uncharacterized protein (DUF427 family)